MVGPVSQCSYATECTSQFLLNELKGSYPDIPIGRPGGFLDKTGKDTIGIILEEAVITKNKEHHNTKAICMVVTVIIV